MIRAPMKIILSLSVLLSSLISFNLLAASAQELDIKSDAALKAFAKEVAGGDVFLEKSHGILIFPSVIKAGIGIGGEYGEGVLRVKGKTVDYYSTAAASIGFQLGAQSKSVVLVFLTEASLIKFRASEGWKAGVDGSVALLEWGAGKDINSVEINDPIVGFIFGSKGLMYNLTIEGSKFTKLER